MKHLGRIISVAFIVVIFAAAIACEVRVWKECRSTNSWWYCMRVLNKQ